MSDGQTLSSVSILVLVLGLIVGGCGPNFKMEPLTGEDAKILAMMGAKPADLSVPETVVMCERFYRALWSKRASNIWSFLSRDTRASLDKLAGKLDTNGRTLLQSQAFPKPGGDKTQTVKVSLAAMFLVRRPVTFEALSKPVADAKKGEVLVINRLGIRRKVQLRRERGEWRIHHVDFAELPPAIDLRPKLLPQDRTPPTPPPTPKVDPTPEAPAPTPEVQPKPEPTAPKSPPADKSDERKKPDLDF